MTSTVVAPRLFPAQRDEQLDLAPLRLQLLGPLRLWRYGVEVEVGSRTQRRLLALLLARCGHPVSMSELVDLLWGDAPPASAINTVHKYVGALRRTLEPHLGPRAPGAWLLRHGPSYLFAANSDVLDLVAFRELALSARRGGTDEDGRGSLTRYVEALGLWHGPAADGLAETPTAKAMFSGLQREYLALAVDAARVARRQERPQLVIDELWRAVALDPLHEPVHAELIATLSLAGQHAEALTVYREIRERLDRDLGIDPTPALRSAYQQIIADPAPSSPAPHSPPSTRGPAQLPADQPYFVGRSALLERLRGQLTEHGPRRRTPAIVAFDGLPGVGKTALALRLAHDLSPAFPDGQLYLDLRGFADGEGPLRPDEALRHLITGLGIAQHSIPDGRQARAGLFRTLLNGRRILILLDDAQSVEQIIDLLPSSGGCLTLVTSRRRLTDLRARAGAQLVPVGLPTLDEARAFLLNYLGDRASRAEPEAVDALIAHCGRLPAALAWAGARAAAYADTPLPDTVAAWPHTGLGVERVFASSFRVLSPSAASLLRVLANELDTTPNVSADDVIDRAGSRGAALDLLEELQQVGLVQETTPGRYDCHPLVRAYAASLTAG